jgi:hypothetical protein
MVSKNFQRGLYKVTRFCCTSGMCFECKERGNLWGSLAGRARIVHMRNLPKETAAIVAGKWAAYEAKAELQV